MVRAELIMEIEWDFAQHVPQYKNDWFHRDFQKLVLGRAPLKVSLFRSQTAQGCQATMIDLKTKIYCLESGGRGAKYLLSSWVRDNGSFTHRTFTR